MTARSICPHCGHKHYWTWEAAFDKFGFSDGDGLVMTEAVASELRRNGYTVEAMHWGFHNTIITRLSRDGRDMIPRTVSLGYDDPREYLPPETVALLDRAFTDVLVEP